MNASVKSAKNQPKETTVVLFGNPKDPDMKTSINRIAITGRKTEVKARPNFDTGLGKCGNHLCHCKEVCTASYDGKAYASDQGAMMGHSF